MGCKHDYSTYVSSTLKLFVSYNHICPFISTLQSLNTLTQESADDEKVEGDPEIIRYLDRSPSETRHAQCVGTRGLRVLIGSMCHVRVH